MIVFYRVAGYLMRCILYLSLSLILNTKMIFAEEISQNHTQNFQNIKIVVIDMEYVLEKSIAMKDIRSNVRQISGNIENEMLLKENELKKIETKLLNKRGTLTEDKFNEKLSEFIKNVNSAQKEVQDKKITIEQAYSDAVNKVRNEIGKIVINLSSKYDFDLVLPVSQILYSKSNLNITNEVVNMLNDSLKYVPVEYEFSSIKSKKND